MLGPGGEQLSELSWNAQTSSWQAVHTNVYAAGRQIATYDADLSGQTEGKVYFQLSDWLGTRRQQTDYAGNPVLNFTGLPFGDGLTTIPVSNTAAADATEHHFTGKERDNESGNDYFGARYYANSMGRFLSPDWSAEDEPVPYAKLYNPQTLNLYAYIMNNPLSGIDPDGHGSMSESLAWRNGSGCQFLMSVACANSQQQQQGEQQYAAMVAAAFAAQQQNGSSGGHSFWSHVGNLLQGHSWNYGMRESVTTRVLPGSESEPNPYVAVGTDALSLAGAATGHAAPGIVGSAISVKNDPSIPNLVMTGMSFVPVVGEAVGAVTAVQDVGLLAGHWITDHVMAPMLNAAPAQTMDDGNGHTIPNPAMMDEHDMFQ